MTETNKRYMLLLNMTGDTTVAWDEADDASMRKWIEEMMEKGYSFFIIEKKWLGLRETKTQLTHIDDLKGRTVTFEKITTGDVSMDSAFQAGLVSVAPAPRTDVETVRRAHTVDEVVRNNTVAMRPLRGG